MGGESQKEKLRLSCFASLFLTVLLRYFLVIIFRAVPQLTEYLWRGLFHAGVNW